MVAFYGTELENRLMLGTSQYPSPAILERAFKASKASVATVSLRREGRDGAGQPGAHGVRWRRLRHVHDNLGVFRKVNIFFVLILILFYLRYDKIVLLQYDVLILLYSLILIH